MTRGTPTVESSFTNHYGEDWIFTFDPDTNTASVRGSDVSWQSYAVIEGVPFGLIMNAEEKEWLVGVWNDICSNVPGLSLYLGKPTELVIGTGHCGLTDNYCPICLLQKKEFEVHHCIWASDGGPNTPSNLLAICNSCHAIITRGSVEDRLPRNQAAFHHQIAYFGVGLFQDAVAAERAGGRGSFTRDNPALAKIVELFTEAPEEKRSAMNQQLKDESRVAYQYFRGIGLGKWPWADFERRVLRPLAEMEGKSDA